ncbi:MAG: hypothetical protein QM770_16560 [Tepidisphaeraceae bacterium]
MSKWITNLTLVTLGLALTAIVGCETVKGVGKDITTAGDAGQRAISGDSTTKPVQ